MRWLMRLLGVVAVLVLLAVACSDDTDTADTTQPAEPIGPEVAGIDMGVLDLPPGDPYEDYVMVQDDTGVIELEIPVDWSFVTTKPVYGFGIDTGRAEDILALRVQATAQPPETELSFGDGDGSGTSVLVGDAASSEEDLLRRLYNDIKEGNQYEEDQCEAAGAFDYDDGTYTGQAELWTNCGTDAEAELLIGFAVGPAAGAEDWEPDLKDYASVRVRLLTDADIDAAIRLIETLAFKPITQ